MKPELGGGRKEFSMADADAFKDFEDTENFLSRYLLNLFLGFPDSNAFKNYKDLIMMFEKIPAKSLHHLLPNSLAI